MGATVFSECFETLAGRWRLNRSISTGEKLVGTCEFSEHDQNCWLVKESGDLHMIDGGTIAASRRWLWRLDGASLHVYFHEDPPRLYHAVKISENDGKWCGSAHHDCPPDTYVGDYEITPEKIIIRQDISGPKKAYRIESEYTRD